MLQRDWLGKWNAHSMFGGSCGDDCKKNCQQLPGRQSKRPHVVLLSTFDLFLLIIILYF